MRYKNTWIIVADGMQAQIYSNKGPGTGIDAVLPEPMAADPLSGTEITNERPGRVFDSAGEGRHGIQPATDPGRHHQKGFAAEIASILDQRFKNNEFQQLVVIAAPKMLGDLRAAFGANIRKLVIAELDKDLSKLTIQELTRRVGEVIKI